MPPATAYLRPESRARPSETADRGGPIEASPPIFGTRHTPASCSGILPFRLAWERLVPGPKFLASKAVSGPGECLKTIGGNFLATPFANAIGPVSQVFQGPVNVLQHSGPKVKCHRRYVLHCRLHREFISIRSLDAGCEGIGFSPHGGKKLIALLQEEGLIAALPSFGCSCHQNTILQLFGELTAYWTSPLYPNQMVLGR